MREQTVIADADGKSSKQIEAKEKSNVDAARPEPKREQANGVQHNYKKTVSPVKTRIFRGSLRRVNCGSGEQKYP